MMSYHKYDFGFSEPSSLLYKRRRMDLIMVYKLVHAWVQWYESFYAFKAKHSSNLLKREYSPSFIKRFTNTVRFSDGPFELKPKTRSKGMKRLAFITRYIPSAAKAMKIIRKYWPSLQQTNLFRNNTFPYPLLCYRSNTNIKSYLV